MKRVLLALLLVPAVAFAQEKPAGTSEDPMAGWVPPKVKNAAKDKQEIQALLRSMEGASKKGDLDAAVALVDFPVMMMTDDSKGEAMGEAWTQEKWTEVMRPFYEKPMKDMKVTHKPDIFLLSDSLATVNDSWKMTQGGKTLAGKNSMIVVRKDGQWRVKAMAEGGWGDMMAAEAPGTATGPQDPASESTGSAGAAGSAGSAPQEPAPPPSGTGVQEPPGSAGSATHEPAAPPAPSGAQEPPERTTK
jgi:ketosteroid isomerase-like protein